MITTVDGHRAETACPGCGSRLPEVASAVHPYMTSSPACWQRYGELLAAQYASAERLKFHQLVVDSYAAQHPGDDDRRAVQSAGIHLMTLCLILERRADPAMGPRLHHRMVERPVFHQLEPPSTQGRLTVLDVPLDGDPNAARAAAFAWAQSVWAAWSPHHDVVRGWVERAGLDTPN